MTVNRGCGWFPETGDQITFRTPNLLLEPMAEKHLGFVQTEVEVEVAGLERAHPIPTMVRRHCCRISKISGWSPIGHRRRSAYYLRFFDVDNQPCWSWVTGLPSAWGRGVATKPPSRAAFAFPHGGRDG